MDIKLDMPFSIARMTLDDSMKGVNQLKKLLTAKIMQFSPRGDHTQTKLCLFEDVRPDGLETALQFRFRTGLLYRVQQAAPVCNLSVEVKQDNRTWPKESLGLSPDQVPLRDYQANLIDKMLKHEMGVLCAATGAGKTWMAASMIAKKNVTTLYLVHTLDLLEQTREALHKLLGIKIGKIGGGVMDVQPVTVGMVQTLVEADLETDFGMLIVDETHHLPADTFFTVTEKFKAPYVYGLSATPYRLDKADLLIEAGAGPIAARISPSELINLGALTRPVIRFVTVPAQTSYDKMPPWMAYQQFIVKHNERNAMIAKMAEESLVGGKTVLIYVRHVKHGQLICKNLTENYIMLDGKDKPAYRKSVLKQLRDKEIRLVVSTLVKEGVDLPSLDVVINAAGGADTMQLVGRALRKAEGKDVATVIDFMDHAHVTLQRSSLARMNRLREEPAFIVVKT
jgi:superfamily II DNA or RNA helicase